MNISQAIERELSAAIRSFCGVDPVKAAEMIGDAKSTAKTLGLPLAETLIHLGFVAAPN